MLANSEPVIRAAMDLPLEARARLIRQLLLSLEPEDADEDSEALWLSEIEAWMDRVETGEYESQDWQESVTWLRSRLTVLEAEPGDGLSSKASIRATALGAVVRAGGITDEDPVEWQRELRRDSVLADRSE